MGFQHIHRFNPLNLDLTKFFPVQSGSLTFTGTNTTQTVLSAVDRTKSVLDFSYEIDTTSDDSDDVMVSGTIDSATDLRFNRHASSGTVTITWYVWEAKPGTNLTVQRGNQDVGSSGSLPNNVSITAVDLDKAFVIISVRSNDASQLRNTNQVRAEITTTTNLAFDKDAQNSNTNVVEWQVVEMTDWDVTKYNIDLAGLSDVNQTLSPAVPTVQSYIVGSGESDGATLNGNEIWRMDQGTDSNLDINRYSSNQGAPCTIYVVNTFGDITTEYHSPSIGGGNSTDNEAITEIDLARSILKLGSLQNSQQSLDDSVADGDAILVEMVFNSNVQTKATRGASHVDTTAYRFAVHQFN